MAPLWAQDRYRLPLGHNASLVPTMDAALRYFQPERYRGVHETAGFMGFR